VPAVHLEAEGAGRDGEGCDVARLGALAAAWVPPAPPPVPGAAEHAEVPVGRGVRAPHRGVGPLHLAEHPAPAPASHDAGEPSVD